MKVEDLYWLAGLLEGEGCFSTRPARGYNYARIVVHMKDRDVIEKLKAVTNAGGVAGPYQPRKPGWSPTFRWAVDGPKAIELMQAVEPLMGMRRRQQIEDALTLCAADRERGRKAIVATLADGRWKNQRDEDGRYRRPD